MIYPKGARVQFRDIQPIDADGTLTVVVTGGFVSGEPVLMEDGFYIPVWAKRGRANPATVMVHSDNILTHIDA